MKSPEDWTLDVAKACLAGARESCSVEELKSNADALAEVIAQVQQDARAELKAQIQRERTEYQDRLVEARNQIQALEKDHVETVIALKKERAAVDYRNAEIEAARSAMPLGEEQMPLGEFITRYVEGMEKARTQILDERMLANSLKEALHEAAREFALPSPGEDVTNDYLHLLEALIAHCKEERFELAAAEDMDNLLRDVLPVLIECSVHLSNCPATDLSKARKDRDPCNCGLEPALSTVKFFHCTPRNRENILKLVRKAIDEGVEWAADFVVKCLDVEGIEAEWIADVMRETYEREKDTLPAKVVKVPHEHPRS